MKHSYSRERSEFWITVHDNADSYNISTSSKYTELIDFFFPSLKANSPIKWKESKNYLNVSSLWLPEGHYDPIEIRGFMKWCDKITQDVIWLPLNKNIEEYFCDELDFCIASDFNFIYGNGRTTMGEAEYQLKYNLDHLNEEEIEEYSDTLINKMMDNCRYVPIAKKDKWYISPMPASKLGRDKIAWMLADEMACRMDLPFVTAELKCEKPQMKNLSIKDKIATWEKIYQDGMVQIDMDVKRRNVIIVDDLYQSGATMWQYASFLKKLGARKVFGIVCVKSLRDSDNT